MKRILVLAGLLLGLTTGVAAAQARVSVALTIGDPHFAGQLVIGRPYYRRYSHPYYYSYRPAPVIVVARRSHRYHSRRYHRDW